MRSTIYIDRRGYWHGRVTVGIRDDGRPDRRHVGGKTKSEVAEKVRAMERERDAGTVRKLGEKWTVSSWLMFWLENIAAPPLVAENTHADYRVDVTKHLVPGIGAHRLDRLAPEHLEKLYSRIQNDGLSAGTAHHVHRTVRAALNEAVRRGHLVRNPALLAKAPVLDEEDVEPYDVPEIQRLLESAARRRNGARWALGLALGLRQGEALGLQWDCVSVDKGTIRIRRSRLRPKYTHGCAATCGQTAGYCPQRINTRAATGGVKSKAGRRTIGLPPPLIALLRTHRAEQDMERAAARGLWRGEGWVFASPSGQPLNPNSDYHQWKRLLKDAGLRESRLHDARHTAATVLLALHQPTPTVMSLMGWSSESMAARYQHVTDTIAPRLPARSATSSGSRSRAPTAIPQSWCAATRWTPFWYSQSSAQAGGVVNRRPGEPGCWPRSPTFAPRCPRPTRGSSRDPGPCPALLRSIVAASHQLDVAVSAGRRLAPQSDDVRLDGFHHDRGDQLYQFDRGPQPPDAGLFLRRSTTRAHRTTPFRPIAADIAAVRALVDTSAKR